MLKLAHAMRRLRKEEKGFTLVELMVVVVIIGVLAAVAIPRFSGIIDNSKVKADIATGKQIKDAIDRYYTERGVYPGVTAAVANPTADQVVAELTAPATPLGTATTAEPYLNAAPKFAQAGGGDSSLAEFNMIFVIDQTNGMDVKVFKLVNGSVPAGATAEWSSN